MKYLLVSLFVFTLCMTLMIGTILEPVEALPEPLIIEVDTNVVYAQEMPLKPIVEPQVEFYAVTAYCSCEKCCGEWADGITYSGDFAHEGITIAADLNKLPLGTKVWIEGLGERVVQDKGGAIKGNRIDVFFYNHYDALKFGKQELEVTILD